MTDQELQTLRDYKERFVFQGGSEFACKLADEIERLRDIVAEQTRTINALMVGMPEDGTTPVIRRIAALEIEINRLRAALQDAISEWAHVVQQRQPLSNEDIWSIWEECAKVKSNEGMLVSFARAVEAMHGIKETK